MTDTHEYLSTACYHGLHDRCRQTCKFCEAKCMCQCHPENAEKSSFIDWETIKRARRMQND
jgi:hypothetical protein